MIWAMTKRLTDPDPARAALAAFLRRLFTRMANEAQRDSLAYRGVLEKL